MPGKVPPKGAVPPKGKAGAVPPKGVAGKKVDAKGAAAPKENMKDKMARLRSLSKKK